MATFHEMFNKAELQEMALMVGSKKGLGQYLGLDPKALNELWVRFELKSPTDYVRSQEKSYLLKKLAEMGSISNLALHFGVSSATMKLALSTLTKENEMEPGPPPILKDLLSKYKSIRLAARMLNKMREGNALPPLSEASLRKAAIDAKLDLSQLLDWTFSNHSNAKGRRAELDFARLRGPAILEDCNVTQGSQATTDFIDKEKGRVNVKSSRMYSYKASTRKDAPDYWKFSLSSIDSSDAVALMAYDKKGRDLVGVKWMQCIGQASGGTITLLKSQLRPPKEFEIADTVSDG